jgi:uncharacterized protein (DUF488 family)
VTLSESKTASRILTIGHSIRSLEELIELLQAHGVTQLIDVRTIPRSRRHPQFNRETLPDSLASTGISYRHLKGLGGLRKPIPESPNQGWQNASFRGYADYMQTREFVENVEELINLARGDTIALMCAEALPWRCHRVLIADALLVRGLTVEHIMSRHRRQMHALTPWAKVEGKSLVYPRP